MHWATYYYLLPTRSTLSPLRIQPSLNHRAVPRLGSINFSPTLFPILSGQVVIASLFHTLPKYYIYAIAHAPCQPDCTVALCHQKEAAYLAESRRFLNWWVARAILFAVASAPINFLHIGIGAPDYLRSPGSFSCLHTSHLFNLSLPYLIIFIYTTWSRLCERQHGGSFANISGIIANINFQQRLKRQMSSFKPNGDAHERTPLINGGSSGANGHHHVSIPDRSKLYTFLFDTRETPGNNSDKVLTRSLCYTWHILKVTLLSSTWNPSHNHFLHRA